MTQPTGERSDPWATKFACHIEDTYGPVRFDRLGAVVDVWARAHFPPAARPRVDVLLAVATAEGCADADAPLDLVPFTDSTLDMVQRGDLRLRGTDFRAAALAWFHRRNSEYQRTGANAFEDFTVVLIVAEHHTCLIYSHLYGDETVFFPKSRRLLLAVSGPKGASLPTPPPLTDDRSLTGYRLVASAAHVALTRPRAAFAAMRTLASEHKERPVACAETTAVDDSWWSFTVAVERESVQKIPSVLLYCTMLREAGISPSVHNHVVAEVRGYSPIVHRTDGNALSHIPFQVDWSTTTAQECARSIATRLRTAEPAIRVAASRVLRKYGPAARGGARRAVRGVGLPPQTQDSTASLVTTMSYYRLPADQTVTAHDGGPILCTGVQTGSPGMLNFNCRDMDGVANITATHWGGLIERERVLDAMVTAAREVGCVVTRVERMSGARRAPEPALRGEGIRSV